MTVFDKLIMQPLFPNWLFRLAIKYLIRQKLSKEKQLNTIDKGRLTSMIKFLSHGPLATDTQEANNQHYEVPPEFFKLALGPHLKYSSCYYDHPKQSLHEAELTMLELTATRARLEDGCSILELGCGWGSLTLFMARRFPHSQITAMSNSSDQKRYIDSICKKENLTNVTVITANIETFNPQQTFDRIISVEMFEHLSNYKRLFDTLNKWLTETGYLFIHVFGHKNFTYPFVNATTTDWMARHFFTGGIMPSEHLFSHFSKAFTLADNWRVCGTHYEKTCNAWLTNTMRYKHDIMAIFSKTYGRKLAAIKWVGWRIFFIACAELFGCKKGSEWMVFHYIFKKKLAVEAKT